MIFQSMVGLQVISKHYMHLYNCCASIGQNGEYVCVCVGIHFLKPQERLALTASLSHLPDHFLTAKVIIKAIYMDFFPYIIYAYKPILSGRLTTALANNLVPHAHAASSKKGLRIRHHSWNRTTLASNNEPTCVN